ncbi:PREDICTED: brefeldin A-inhibited guanine nucleotide-exchange protein 4-like isoform X1 [Camelina sativa]|uniref:Brefeldin A-inhibited guanine nucleotide-exchange protein 4-like isoform X1 n=1 Tax=Camelina sativa TaxID=90675 RepID=A0ABM0TW08_CAMSA|nr:PREDICTED: brefeldin A-inhibited guanine nucleotide-exchange protein 4-like isoform X1 [Camelina sativa]
MSTSQTLGGATRCGRIIGPSLDKIIKNAAWRKHTYLVSSCKSVLDKLESLPDDFHDPSSVVSGLAASEADSVLQPFLFSLDTAYSKVVEPSLDCAFKLFSLSILRGEIQSSKQDSILFKLVNAVSKVGAIAEEPIQLAVLRVLLAAVRSPCVLIRGDCLLHVVKTCYNIYLGGLSGTTQTCAKSVLAQMMLVIFTRSEEDSLDVSVKTVYVNELLTVTDKSVNEGSSVYFCQGFVNEVMAAGQGSPLPPPDVIEILLANPETETVMTPDSPSFRGYVANGEGDSETGDMSKMRQDAFLLFKNLCKLSMRFSSKENNDDQIMVRGKTLSLELLKVIIDNGGSVWRSNDSFINAVKQYLCLSLLKNSAVSIMSIFQLQCAIFMSLLSKLRSVLKAEIGIFFPMIVLRVLENVLQPSYLQKMTVLNLLDKMSQDPQLIVDIFVNYDCDVDSANILERIVNGLLKTALGPPTGSSTTLSPAQDSTFRNDSVKCLVNIAKAMGNWMDQQLKVNETVWPKGSQVYASMDSTAGQIGELEGTISDCDSQPDTTNPEAYDASMLQQRRAYKIELQKGISLFNRKPSKGIEFLISSKKIGSSPEEVASFLMKTAGLNGTVIGDYLGERDELPLKVMHAYVDSCNFEKKDFVEAIRFFLRGFRLPGEAQKIDRIMEKFAEHYWKCNPGSFTSADTAYVLAYSVIMLNTDAHNNMVKDKMTKADFIRNNRGIDDGKDLPEEYLGSLYDRVVKEEIKMNSDTLAPQNKQVNGLNKLLGLDGILNLVSWMQPDEKPHGANGRLIRDIQEQFQAKPEKSESVYHTVTDISILRFILEVSWGPMLAAFSVTLDQSDDRLATSLCLQGFRYAVHVTAVMGMQTQRDAFVTSMAKFTNLHCAADMKQKNVDAVKAIITIAIEDGNHLHGSWEHILTCLSRIEHLQLLGEVPPSESRYIPTKKAEVDEKKALGFPNLKKRGSFQNPSVMAVVRGGSYDSTSLVKSVPKLVTPEQIKSFIANLNLLDQIGNFELNHVYANSQRLNSEAIVSFVKALCKVSMSELQSPTDPRVFSLTKLVETAHYNMNRIRLVWSRIWNVLSDFFVSVGLSENLSVAIFVMDSLRQLSMKFLEREELANYHFQHEFLRPFVVVMQKSSSAEIRELIVRCVSQMVLSRVSNVKSGWKNVFTVFTTAALDERKNIVLLAFETIEKIVRDHFHCITETEITVYADCIRCLITFTNSKFEGDIGFNTIEFLRFCASKLAEGGLVLNEKLKNNTISALKEDSSDTHLSTDLDEQVSYWVPLLTGLSKQASDPRPAIRKRSIEVLFNILTDHGHLFTRPFWTGIFSSIILPVFNNNIRSKTDMLFEESVESPSSAASQDTEETTWDSETSTLALQLLVDLLVFFFSSVRSQLPSVLSILIGFIKSPFQGSTGSGISVLLRLADGLSRSAYENEWTEIFLALKEAASLTFAGFMKVLRTMDDIEDVETVSGQSVNKDDLDDDSLHIMSYVVSRTKKHIDVLSQIVEVVSDLYRKRQFSLSASHVDILADIFSCIASHAQELNSDIVLRRKFKRACAVQNLTEPQLLNFENESNKSYMTFLQDMVACNPNVSKELDLEYRLVTECAKVVKIYLKCTDQQHQQKRHVLWILPMESDRLEEATARTALLVSSLEALCSLEAESLKRHVSSFFPLLVDLVRTEHCSPQVPYVLSNVLKSCIGPILA